MTTGTITTWAPSGQISGLAGLAVRVGHALEDWGRRQAQPRTREELVRQNAMELEARAAVAHRSDAFAGVYYLLR